MATTSVGRRGVGAGFVVALVIAVALLPVQSAEGALESFVVSPSSGSPGSTVIVSGTDCRPGLVPGTALNHVEVLGPTLPVDLAVPTDPSGAWSGAFVVPVNAAPIAHVLTATCISGGSASLMTIYEPQTFTVTASGATTTTVSTTTSSTSVPVSSSSVPSSGSSGAPATTSPVGGGPGPAGDAAGAASSPPVRLTPDGGDASGVPSRVEPASGASASTAGSDRPLGSDADVVASRLGEARATRSQVPGGPTGSGWWAWMVWSLVGLCAVAVLGAAAWFIWLRHTRAREWWIAWLHQLAQIRTRRASTR